MLATLCFWPLLGLRLTYAATINVIPASDPSLVYSPGWSQEFSQSTQDSFMQAEGFGCSLSVTLPTNASSVSYVGFKRAGGSIYGYTLDCEEDCVLQTANGSDPTATDNASVPQSTLFTLALDPTTQHTLYVYNLLSDQSDGFSQINLNNLNVALEDSNGSNDVPGAGGGPQPQSDTASASSSSSPTSSAGSSVSEQASSPTTSTSPSSSTGATLNSSNSVSATPASVGVASSSATKTDSKETGSSASSVTDSATPTNPVLQSSSSSSSSPTSDAGSVNAGANAGPSSGSGKTGGVSKSVAIGVSVLAVVFGGALIAALVVFIRQRRRKRNSYSGSFSAGSEEPPLSPTGSIIPIMPPPQMRTASPTYAIPNPFIDPPSEPPPLDIPFNSSLMQRRMEGRTSPGSPASPAPNIPLPDIPRGGTDSRSSSPAAVYARNDLWITRSPAKPAFTVL